MASGSDKTPSKDNPTATGKCDGRTVVVMGVPIDFSLEVVQLYFENNRKSNGGPITQELISNKRTGCIQITFESAKDAENVLKKKIHKSMGLEMEVSLYKPSAVYKDMIFVSNVQQTTRKDTLMVFLKTKTQIDVEKILPGNEAGSFLVYFHGIIDFEKVEEVCKTTTLAGNFLQVSEVPVTSTILVRNVPSQIDSDIIELYFENPVKSSGGETSDVKQLSGESYLVVFKDERNVTTVCNMEHTLLGTKLEVTPYYELLEGSVISQEETFEHTEVRLQSSLQLKFFMKHKTIIEDQLQSTAQVIWAESQGDKLKLRHKKGNNEETHKKILTDLLEKVNMERIDIPEGIFEEVKEEIENMVYKPSIFFDQESHSGVIMGFNKGEVDELKEIVLNDIINPKCKTEEISLNQYKIDLLLADNFHVRMENEYNGLKITYINGKIAFKGHSSQVMEVTIRMFQFLDSIVSSVLYLPLNTDKIINNPPVKCYLNEKMKETNCIGAWQITNGSFFLYSTSDESIRKIGDIIKIQFKVLNFNNNEKMEKILKILKSKNWENFLKEIEKKFKDLYYIDEIMFSIVTIDKVFQEIRQHFDKFFEVNIENEKIMPLNRSHFLFLKKFKEAHMNDWCVKSGLSSVKVTFNVKNELYLTGSKTELDKTASYIEKLIGDIQSKEKIFDLQSFGNFLKTYKGDRFLSEIEQSTSCIILKNSITEEKPLDVSLVFHAEERNIQRAMDEVKIIYETQLITKEIIEAIITELPEVKLSIIKDIGSEYDVLVELEPSCNRISVYGRKKDVSDTVVSIQELLLETQSEKEKVMVQQMEVMVQRLVQWCYISDKNQSFKPVPFSADINFELERAFLNKQMQVTINEMQFTIKDSGNMYQLVNSVKVKIVRKNPLKENDLPEHWSPMRDDQYLLVVDVQRGKEYDSVKDAFAKNLKSKVTIRKIERIQNITLYRQYRAQLEKMKIKNAKGTKNETQRLWYGCAPGTNLQKNENGFKFSDYGKKGSLPYGEGIYFGVDINSAVSHSSPNSNGEKLIYMCNVLTGVYCQGKTGLMCLPSTNAKVPVQYDSAVDNVNSPRRYVIFNDIQAYPHYLITFK